LCLFIQTPISAELDTFANESDVIWRGFVASAIAAVALQWMNPFGTGKLVLFQVTFVSDSWRAFELVSPVLFEPGRADQAIKIPWVILSVIGVISFSFATTYSLTLAGCIGIFFDSLKRRNFSLPTQHSSQRLACSGGYQR
jgi:hypothetical protein